MKLRNCRYVLATGTTGRYAGCDVLAHPEMNQLDCLWNSGFYSNQSQVFLSLLILLSHGIIPETICYALGFRRLKKDPNRDVYHDFYRIDPNVEVQLLKTVTLPDENRKQFDLYDFEYYNPIVKRFFTPSDVILERKNILMDKYEIDPDKTISVLYRGTDKSTELVLAHPQDYLIVTQRLLQKNPDFKVLLQTDQTQVIQMFVEALGDKVVFFEETPSTTGRDSMISAMERDNGDMTDWMQWFDAALRVVASCSSVVSHTGNCGLWMNLYRGSTTNVFQFDELGAIDLG